ncbi:hypothetical protein O9992_20775 [Vibrio lentus]|nr:hypothetical protein [Vibrio lentus]
MFIQPVVLKDVNTAWTSFTRDLRPCRTCDEIETDEELYRDGQSVIPRRLWRSFPLQPEHSPRMAGKEACLNTAWLA